MPITVTCPTCQSTLRAPDQAAGRKVKCPKCATAFEVAAVATVLPDDFGPAIRQPSTHVPPVPRPVAPARDEYYEPAPRSRRAEVAGGMPQPTGAQVGLGISSLVVGIVGLVISLIPCLGWIGIPVAGVGLVLGAAGLIIAIVRNGHGIAFPISGVSVSLVGLVVAFIWLYLVHRAVTRFPGEMA